MNTPSNRELRGAWRRRLFWAWVVASAAVAIYIGVAGPFTSYFGEGRSYVALALPAVMFFMLATGFGWLVLLIAARPGPLQQRRLPERRRH
jgi:uncharacterized membrane protein YhaH (DUF805 family)